MTSRFVQFLTHLWYNCGIRKKDNGVSEFVPKDSTLIVKQLPPEVVANYFIEKGLESKQLVNHLQLQKLVYIAHGFYLAFFDQPLLNESPQAWQYGPVIPGLYHKLKRYGLDPIKRKIAGYGTVEDEEAELLLRAIWMSYGNLPATTLSQMTHVEGTPWSQTPQGSFISDVVIQEYYKRFQKIGGDGGH